MGTIRNARDNEAALVKTLLARSRQMRSADNARVDDVWVHEASPTTADDSAFSLVKGRRAHWLVRQHGDIDDGLSGRNRTGLWFRHVRHVSACLTKAEGRPITPAFTKQVRGLGFVYRGYTGLERLDVVPVAKEGLAFFWSAPKPREIKMEFRLAHDWMWPAPSRRRTYRLTRTRHGVRVSSRIATTAFDTDGHSRATIHWKNDRVTVRWPAMRSARLYLSGDDQPWDSGDLASTLSTHERSFQAVRLETPSYPLNKTFRWAQHDLDEMFSEASVGNGWYAGAPCFSWFYGRDGEWTSMAAVMVGRGDDAAAHLETLRRHARAGQIPHEIILNPRGPPARWPAMAGKPPETTQYMSIDSNLLWVLAQVRRSVWTGEPIDRQAVREALAFSNSCDRDGDGLLENDFSRQLIGWTETWAKDRDGPCIDVNGWWLAALTEYARLTGEDPYDYRAVRRALRTTFFRGRGHGVRTLDSVNGPVRRWVRTPAMMVPAMYEADPLYRSALARISGPDLVTPWGVRSLSGAEPAYDGGYHTGVVWPLMTGWFVLAAFRQGLDAAGLRALLTFPDLAFGAADPGRIAEAYHGEFPAPTGQFAQAWSSALLIQSVIEGLFGIGPSGGEGIEGLAEGMRPHLPDDWPRMTLRRVPYRGDLYRIEVDHTGPRVSREASPSAAPAARPASPAKNTGLSVVGRAFVAP